MIRYIDGGASGTINLVRSKHDGEQYALKQFNLLYLTDKDKQNAINEVALYKVLTGPTLIRFVESFTENNSIYIVMEYADGGSLANKVTRYITQGLKFQYEDILKYMA